MTQPTKIGVTGVAGFIGSHLCERLLAEGREVVGVDDLSHGSPSQHRTRSPCDAVPLPSSWTAATRARCAARSRGCDAIVHLAAEKIPRYGGALKTLRGQRRRRRRRSTRPRWRSTRAVIVASTSDVYGNAHAAVRRGRHADARPAHDAPLGLRHLEALRRARRAGAGRGAAACGHDPAPLRLLRPAQPPELVGRPAGGVLRGPARRQAHGHPRRRPPGPHVHLRDDTVDGFVRALDTPEAEGEILNIGGDEPTTIVRLAQRGPGGARHDRAAARALRARTRTSAARYQDVRCRIPDTSKAAGCSASARPSGCRRAWPAPPPGTAPGATSSTASLEVASVAVAAPGPSERPEEEGTTS